MDLSGELMHVLTGGEERAGLLNFVQIDSDVPHIHLTKNYKHPVSGVVATCGLLHANIMSAMYGHAVKYLKHMEDMKVNFVDSLPLSCRLEQVKVFNVRCLATIVDSQLMFKVRALWDSILSRPLIVPF